MSKPDLFKAPQAPLTKTENVGRIDIVKVPTKEFHQLLLAPANGVLKMHVSLLIAASSFATAIQVVKSADAAIASLEELGESDRVLRDYDALSQLLESKKIKIFDAKFSFHTEKYSVKNADKLPSNYNLETVKLELTEAEIKEFKQFQSPAKTDRLDSSITTIATAIERQVLEMKARRAAAAAANNTAPEEAAQ